MSATFDWNELRAQHPELNISVEGLSNPEPDRRGWVVCARLAGHMSLSTSDRAEVYIKRNGVLYWVDDDPLAYRAEQLAVVLRDRLHAAEAALRLAGGTL